MRPEGRSQQKIKLARYRARVDVTRDQFPLHAKGEEEVRAEEAPPSPSDAPTAWSG
jgi:hypothetical protein